MRGTRSLQTVYHLLDKRNWESFQVHGLLSSSYLAQMSDRDAVARLSQQRMDGEVLSCGAFIRNQLPMPPKALTRCLKDGVTPEEWYRLLNSKVFFWIDPERLNRQRKACGPHDQIALVINATQMLAHHAQAAAVTPINTGNAMRAASPRNRSTFVPYLSWVQDGWNHEQITGANPRPASHKPIELALEGAVPDVADYVIDVIHLPDERLLG